MNRTDHVILILAGVLMTGVALFIAWDDRTVAENRSAERQVQKGKRLFQQQGCNACHSVDGSPNTGPTMEGLFGSNQKMRDGSTVQVDESYFRMSIRHPERHIVKGYPDNMPSYDHLSEQKVDLLISYLKRVTETENNGATTDRPAE